MTHSPEDTPAAIAKLTAFVTFRLAKTQNKLTAQTNLLLRSHSDLSVAEWRVLRLLDAGGPTTMATLARQVQMDKGQLSRKIKGLAARDLIDIRPDPRDSRRQTLHMSDGGRAMVERLVPIIARRKAQLTRDIDPEDMRVFMRVLAHLDEASDLNVAIETGEAAETDGAPEVRVDAGDLPDPAAAAAALGTGDEGPAALAG